MARFYANEQFPGPTVSYLRSLGHDVLTTHEALRSNQGIPDPEVLAFARAEQRAVLTLNRKDFIRLHKQVPDHPGIVICSDNKDWIELAELIHQAVLSVHDLRGQLVRVVKPNRPQR